MRGKEARLIRGNLDLGRRPFSPIPTLASSFGPQLLQLDSWHKAAKTFKPAKTAKRNHAQRLEVGEVGHEAMKLVLVIFICNQANISIIYSYSYSFSHSPVPKGR